MCYYISTIKVNKLFHLQDLEIPISEKNPHLIITGKNGSGKTILIKAIADFLELVRTDNRLSYLKIEKNLQFNENQLNICKNPAEKLQYQKYVELWENNYTKFFGKAYVEFTDVYKMAELIQKNEFIMAFYPAARKIPMLEPNNPLKPDLPKGTKVTDNLTDKFLFFLADLKVQEALARNEQQYQDADAIKVWFDEFERLLQNVYQDSNLRLIFNYKNYSFSIQTQNKEFKFTQMSDGFMAAIDIIADLILKMQNGDSPTYSYQKKGIVLIDEIETHLHLGLQRIVMPLLTKLFPNIQFIVTTHSPFVLSSMENAVAYDLEHRSPIEDLTEYSYESLAEGYFGVRTDSSYMEMRLESLKQLLEKDHLNEVEQEEARNIIKDFENIPEAVSPLLVGEYMNLKIKYSETFNSLKK